MLLIEARAQLESNIDFRLYDPEQEFRSRLGKFNFPSSLLREWYEQTGFIQYFQDLPWEDEAAMWVFSVPQGEAGRYVNPLGGQFLRFRPGYRKMHVNLDLTSTRLTGNTSLELRDGKKGKLTVNLPEAGWLARAIGIYRLNPVGLHPSDLEYHTRFLQAARRVPLRG